MAETKTAQPEKPLNPTFMFTVLKQRMTEEYANGQNDLSKVRQGFGALQEISVGPLSENKELPSGTLNRFLQKVSDILIEELESIRANRKTARFTGGGAVPAEFTMFTDYQPNAVTEVTDLIQEIQQWQREL